MNARPRNAKSQPAAMPQGQVVAEFSQYAEATAFVEGMLAKDFPSGMIAIVGSDLRSVERVRGKLSYARIALGGATTGAWIGLIFGVLFSGGTTDPNAAVATSMTGLGSVGASVVIAAGIGMLINVIRFSVSKNKRGFISQSTVVASKYQVQVPGALADHPALTNPGLDVSDGSGKSDA
jgi:hypothetical protein